jgi:hypothetical protein
MIRSRETRHFQLTPPRPPSMTAWKDRPGTHGRQALDTQHARVCGRGFRVGGAEFERAGSYSTGKVLRERISF